MGLVVCGSGHRPNKLKDGYTEESQQFLCDIASDWLEKNHVKKVISGMALGWDQAIAKAAINLNIPLIAAVPFKGQESRWPKESQDQYNILLDECLEVVIVSEGGYQVYKLQIRNQWMVDNSDLTLALWDGTKGGTYNHIKYANKMQKPVKNLYPYYERKFNDKESLFGNC